MRYIAFLICFTLSVSTFAQEGELPEEQIIIQKDKKIVLPEVVKPLEKVTISLKALPKVKQKYSYREFGLVLPLLDPKLNPPVLAKERDSPVKEGFVRLGAGNYGSTLLDAFYNSGRRKDYAFGVYLKHLASANGPVANSGFSNNEAGAYGKYFTPNFTVDGGLTYKRGRSNFYGYDQEAFKNRKADSTKQVLQSIWFSMGLENNAKNKPINYKVGLGIGNIADRFKASETEIDLDFNGKYRIGDSSSVNLFSDLALIKRSDSSSVNRSLWRIEPTYRFGYKGFQILAGFQVALSSEPELLASGYSASRTGFHAYPVLGIQQNLVEKKLVAYAGFRGGMNKRTLRSSLEVNPFLGPDSYLRHENQLFVFDIGVKGNLNGQFQYRTGIAADKLEQQGFFINRFDRREQFALVYDSSSTSRFIWETELIYDLGEKTRAGFKYTYITYKLNSLKEPWHAPNSVLTLFGRQQISDQLMLSAEFYYMGGLRGLNPETAETEKIKGLADLNLKGEYFFKKRFSGFISAHNLLNNKNQRFLYYPTQGFRIMVGATATF